MQVPLSIRIRLGPHNPEVRSRRIRPYLGGSLEESRRLPSYHVDIDFEVRIEHTLSFEIRIVPPGLFEHHVESLAFNDVFHRLNCDHSSLGWGDAFLN